MVITIMPAIKGALYLSGKISIIIILLTIAYEIYEHSGLYKKTKQILDKPLNGIGISGNASLTMIVGLILGIVYGASILIKDASEGSMNHKDIILSVVFLSICHAVIEDTLIFVAVGANGFIVLGSRVILALAIAKVLNKLWKK